MTDETVPNGPSEVQWPTEVPVQPAAGALGVLSYEGAAVRVLQLIGGIDPTPITPDLVLVRVIAFLANTDTQVRQLHEALDQQNSVLMQLAVLADLKDGDLYTKMHDIFKAWKPETATQPDPAT